MVKTGIITYHSAYNFGSMLQAFATQNTLKRLGFPTEIINYRLAEQKYFYQRMLRLKYGFKTVSKDLLMLPVINKRIERMRRFEVFINDWLDTTKEVSEPDEVYELWKKYDNMISGSDQIWSKNSHELRDNDWLYMDPYLLKSFQGRKISYASSLGSMTDEQIQRIIPCLKEFDFIAFREMSSARRLQKLIGRNMEVVLDPTFLLTKNEWIDTLKLRNTSEKYILLYSLRNPQTLEKLLRLTHRLAILKSCKVQVVAPFAWIPTINRDIEFHPEYGPIDFLNALYNAEAIITDSYHGTILSINFEKEFYTIGGNKGTRYRMSDILEQLGLETRLMETYDYEILRAQQSINYNIVGVKLEEMRKKSFAYLKKSLEQ